MISRKDQDGSITHIIRWLSPLPPWIWDLYDPICLADRVKAELSKLRMTKMAVDCLPDDPADLAWYKHTNLHRRSVLQNKFLCNLEKIKVVNQID